MMSEKAEGAIKDTNQMVEELKAKLERLTEEKEKSMEINENLRKETLNAKQEMQKKVNEMTQVNNMKKMI
jgi:dynactin complex subunit